MRAIDILFDEIDRINSQIKLEENMDKKVTLALNMRKIVDIIEDTLRIEGIFRFNVVLEIDRGDFPCYTFYNRTSSGIFSRPNGGYYEIRRKNSRYSLLYLHYARFLRYRKYGTGKQDSYKRCFCI